MSRNEDFTIKWTNLFSVAYQNISKDPCYWQINKDIRMQLFTFSKCIQTMNKIGAIIPSMKTKSAPINQFKILFAKICFRQGFTVYDPILKHQKAI